MHETDNRMQLLQQVFEGTLDLSKLRATHSATPAPVELPDTWGEEHVAVRPSDDTDHGYRYTVAVPIAKYRDCPVCHGDRWLPGIERDEHGYTCATRCACYGLHDRIAAFNAASILYRYADASLTPVTHAALDEPSFDWRLSATVTAWRTVRNYVVGWSPNARGLVLWGTTGAGKSHVAYAIARRLTLTHAVKVRCVVWDVLLSRLQATFGSRSGPSESDILQPYLDAELLVVDEVGGGDQASEWNRAVFDRLVRRRLDDGRTFILTTNLVPEPRHRAVPGRATPARTATTPLLDDTGSELTLRGRFGQATYSRLVGGTFFVPMVGDDYRERFAEAGWTGEQQGKNEHDTGAPNGRAPLPEQDQ